MTEVYKVVSRLVRDGTQLKKWEYIGKDKFDRYSPDVIKRIQHKGTYLEQRWIDGKEVYSKYYDARCDVEIYKMIEGKYELIEKIPYPIKYVTNNRME